jgi:polar amino acid transport system permease protein
MSAVGPGDGPSGSATRRAAEPTSAVPSVVPVRHPWRYVAAGLVLAGFGFLIRAFATADIDWAVVPRYLTEPVILSGLRNTLILTLLCMAVGVVLGVLAAVMKQSENPVLRIGASAYIWFFRGTPVLVQLLIWFNLSLIFQTIGIPGVFDVSTNVLMTPFVAAVLGLGLNEGSYMAEIVRGGMLAVDRGQVEAAQAVGLTRSQTLRRIILPQALRVIIPPTGNEVISMLKYTSLAYVIAYNELLSSAYKIYSSNLKVIELLLTASIWYLVLTTVLTVGQHYLEKRFNRSSAAPAVGRRLALNVLGRARR